MPYISCAATGALVACATSTQHKTYSFTLVVGDRSYGMTQYEMAVKRTRAAIIGLVETPAVYPAGELCVLVQWQVRNR